MEKFHSFDLKRKLNKFWKKKSHIANWWVYGKKKIVQSMRKLDSEIFFVIFFLPKNSIGSRSIMYGNSFRDDFVFSAFFMFNIAWRSFASAAYFFPFRFFRHNKNWWFSLSLLLNFKWCKIRGAPLVIFLRIVPLSFWILHNFLAILWLHRHWLGIHRWDLPAWK